MFSTSTLRRMRGEDGSSLGFGSLSGAEPLGFAAGDTNLYRYVGNDPVGEVDPTGLAGRPSKGDWRLDLADHGGSHIQKGNDRWSATDLRPLEHNGRTPNPLTRAQLVELGQRGILDRITKNVADSIVNEIAQNLAQEALNRGLSRLSKTALKELAERIARRAAGPLALLLAAYSVASGASTSEQEIRNAVLPADLIDSAVDAAQSALDAYLSDANYRIEYKRFIAAGYSSQEAAQMAKDNYDSKKMDRNN